MKKLLLLPVNLFTFDESAEVVVEGDDSPVEVVYGKQEGVEEHEETEGGETEEEQEGEETTEDGEDLTPEQQFEQMIKGDYKEHFDKRVQNIINKRFKETKTLEAQIGAYGPVIELLMDKHKVSTMEELQAKIEDENIEELAYEHGMDAETYKKYRELERENNKFKLQQKSQIEQQQQNDRVAKWFVEESELKQQYPDFDLKEWGQNSHFVEMLEAGLSVKTAYEVCDIENIKASTAKKVQKATVDNIKANSNRPKENASKKQAKVIHKSDPSQLSRADIKEIERRVLDGEKITF